MQTKFVNRLVLIEFICRYMPVITRIRPQIIILFLILSQNVEVRFIVFLQLCICYMYDCEQ